MRRRTGVAVGTLGLLSGIGAAAAVVWGGYPVSAAELAPTLVLDLAVAWSFIGVGLYAWSRRPDSRGGALMVALGFAWLLRSFGAVDSVAAFRVGVALGSLYLGVLTHLLVSFPTGRLSTTTRRLVVGFGYLLTVPLNLTFLLLPPTRGCWDCRYNLVVITAGSGPVTFDAVDLLVLSIIALFDAVVLGIVLGGWRRGTSRQRRALAPGVWGGVTIIVAIIAHRVGLILGVPAGVLLVLRWTSEVVLIVWPLALLFGVLRSRLDRSGISHLVLELGSGLPSDRLQDVLAHTLHDPTVRLAYWLPQRQAFVDARGDPVAVAPDPQGRALTYLERDGAHIAVIEHDAALSDDPELVRAVAAGAGMALENERLHAEVRAQLREVQASRARIVEAADGARRRVERDLHDGAQQRLVSVALGLTLVRARLASAPTDELDGLLQQTSAELVSALDELRELARGIYPVLLTDAGLGPALTALAERSPIPAVLATGPDTRLPEPVERAAYFVVSEALANAAKHSAAGSITIDARSSDGGLVVEVTDDGVGGADAGGSGLRGLADRVAAAGGRLRVESPAGGGGTRLTAELPARPRSCSPAP